MRNYVLYLLFCRFNLANLQYPMAMLIIEIYSWFKPSYTSIIMIYVHIFFCSQYMKKFLYYIDEVIKNIFVLNWPIHFLVNRCIEMVTSFNRPEVRALKVLRPLKLVYGIESKLWGSLSGISYRVAPVEMVVDHRYSW